MWPFGKREQTSKTNRTVTGNRGLSYDAAHQSTILRPVKVSHKSEDAELTRLERQRVISSARDQLRNFTLAGFCVRKYLQSIAWYQFRARTAHPAFNQAFETRIKRWMLRDQCDAARRHDFLNLIYLAELMRAVDGDVGLLFTRDNSIQLIESDRICNCIGADVSEEWVHGVRIGKSGQALEYQLARRSASGLMEPERRVPARYLKLIGYHTRADQVRGVSLMAPAIKFFNYLYEGIDLALAKMKLEQVLGIKTTFENDGPIGYNDQENPQEREAAVDSRIRDVFGEGIMRFSLHPGESAEFMESNNPSANFMQFCEQTIRIVFAAFDIPYSFYDGSKTTFYGSEGEFEQYIDSIERKQSQTISALNEITFDGLLHNFVAAGELEIPPGVTLEEIRSGCTWIGAGLPNWRMFRNIKNYATAIQLGMLSPCEAAADYGYDLRENLKERAEIEAYAKELGIILPYTVEKINLGI